VVPRARERPRQVRARAVEDERIADGGVRREDRAREGLPLADRGPELDTEDHGQRQRRRRTGTRRGGRG
jgi:hypothetical protein